MERGYVSAGEDTLFDISYIQAETRICSEVCIFHKPFNLSAMPIYFYKVYIILPQEFMIIVVLLLTDQICTYNCHVFYI